MNTLATHALSLLQSCLERKDIDLGRKLHILIVANNFDGVVLIQDQLIRLFASCGCLFEASLLYCNALTPNSCTWQAIINAFVSLGESEKALELYQKMQEEGSRATKYIYTCLLKACGYLNALVQGECLHDDVIKDGYHQEIMVGNALIDMYAKCGRMEEAFRVFDCLLEKDPVTWNTVIASSSEQGNSNLAVNLFAEMQQQGVCPDTVTYLGVSKACRCTTFLEHAKQVHCQVGNACIEEDVVLGSCFVDMYGKCGSIELAQEVFNALTKRNIVSWNGLIGGYAQQELNCFPLEFLQKIDEDNLEPNFITFLCLLKVCSNMGSLKIGQVLHALILKYGLDVAEGMGNSLVDMYSKCANLELAQRAFDHLPSRDVVSWCALLSGYSENGLNLHALELFKRMQEENMQPDRAILVCILKACASIENLFAGDELYELIIGIGMEEDVSIGNALIGLYGKWGRLEDATRIFNQLSSIDAVSCNSMMFLYLENGRDFEMLEILDLMRSKGLKADSVTLLSCLMACGRIGASGQGKSIHELVVREAFESDTVIGTTLVDMYFKFGNLDEASNVFRRLANPNVVSWTALIVGYAQQGKVLQALQFMREVEKKGLQLDGRIHVSLFMACSHAGYVKEGCQHFEKMIHCGVFPTAEHANCLAELLSRSGCLKEAEKVLQSMPASDDVSGWVSLLTACKAYGNSQLGADSFEEAVK